MVFKCELMLSIMLLLASVSSSHINKRSNKYEWDHLIFAQQWPEAVCEQANATGQQKCEIPSKTKTWTVHGLWPKLGSTQGPQRCNESWKFNVSKVESILPELKMFWPNLYTDRGLAFLWKHEWEKHGTCAASLDSLRGEMKYFSAGLSLNKKYDVLGALSRRGISPSSSQEYATEDVIGALEGQFGRRICITCFYSKKTKMMLKETRICFNKKLNIIDCPNNCSKSCMTSKELVYHPLASNASGFVHDILLIKLFFIFSFQVLMLSKQ